MKHIATTTLPDGTTTTVKRLSVQSTAQPNGDITRYKQGMPKPEILPSNHPIVAAMRYQRAVNEFKGCKSALRQAKKLLEGKGR